MLDDGRLRAVVSVTVDDHQYYGDLVPLMLDIYDE